MKYTTVSHYNQRVKCGNLFLEGDIGNGINTPPVVNFAGADPDASYALIMVDPDSNVDLPFPECTAAGSTAPVRHWVVGNIPGSALASLSDLGDFTTVSPYHGPSPSSLSHRYGQFLFVQPAGVIDFAVYNSTEYIGNWDYGAWVTSYGLGEPVASNWHITMHTD